MGPRMERLPNSLGLRMHSLQKHLAGLVLLRKLIPLSPFPHSEVEEA